MYSILATNDQVEANWQSVAWPVFMAIVIMLVLTLLWRARRRKRRRAGAPRDDGG
jgi:hypothetical protein